MSGGRYVRGRFILFMLIVLLLFFTNPTVAHYPTSAVEIEEVNGLEIPNKILANFEDKYVDICFDTKNITAKKTTEISYSEPYSMNITYTKLPCEESWNQSFGFGFPSSLRDINNYSAISMRVYGTCSIGACLGTSDSEGCAYLGTRSSTEPDTWNQLVWDLHAHDVNLSNAICITFLLEDETGVTRTFFLDDIELIKRKIPQTGLLTNFEDYYVDIYFDTKNMTAKKTSERSYSAPYSMNITYTKLPYEEGWQGFGFGFPSSLRDISNYSAISMRVYGSCSISACLDTGDSEGCAYLGTRSSTEPDTWNQLVWDLHAHDVNLSNAICITFLLEDETGVTRTFFLDDIGLTKMDVPQTGLLANFEDNYVDIYFDTKNITAKKTSEISYSEPYSMNITYTKLPCEESWNQSFGFGFPSSLRDINNYSVISMRVYGTCSIGACLGTSDSEGCAYLGTRSSTEPDTWNQLVWDLHAHDVNLSNAIGITFLLEDEIGVTRTFFLDGIELTTMDVPKSGLLANFEDNYVDIWFCTKDRGSTEKTSERAFSEPYSMKITYTKLSDSGGQAFGFELPCSLHLTDYRAISICVYDSCSIRAFLITSTNEWMNMGLRSSKSNSWDQLIWNLTATDEDLLNVMGIRFVMEDEIGTTRTFFVDDIELAAKMTQPPKVLSYAPASPVSDLEGSTRMFNLTLDQIANLSWLVNGTEIFNETEVTGSTYTNTSAAVGIWNVSAVVSNPNGATMQTWDWIVTKPVFGVNLSASADALSTAPSENSTYLLTISNTGTVTDTYTLSLENPGNADVAALSTYYITNLAAGASTTVLLNVTDTMASSYIVRVKVTSEGDSTKSATINTTTTVEDTTPPACIIKLKNTTYASTYINWTWNDPADADLSHVMVYLNGSFQINVSKGTQFYNATELTPDTAYTIGIRTVDRSGNINQTWVNHTVSLSSNNIYVPDDYPTIQAAVDVASPGNTIIVRNGMYTENVDVNKRLTIHSENGTGASIVHAANPKDHVFKVTANYVNISGFTVKGATEWVAGIYLENVDRCCVINNYVSNNYNGITLKNSSGNMVSNNNVNSNKLLGIDVEYSSNNNIIKNNSVSSNKYGINIRTSCNNNIITDNDVNSNTKAGILIDSCNNNVITNNTACHNYDRGIEISSSSNNIVSGNIASFNERYGIIVDESSSNSITNNTANSNSNGICLRDSSNNYIYRNNLKSNDYNVDLHNSNNIWNTPSKITYIYNGSRYTNYLGNYWGDYKKKYPDAEEIGGCGIWDTTHKIDSDNSDKYPLIDEFEIYRVVPQLGIVTIEYSIIIAGRRDDDRGHSSIYLSANNAYKVLLKRGFTREQIFYLNPLMEQDANDDGAFGVDRISSLTNVSYAINTWAQGNVSVDVALLIYMVGHGRKDKFIVSGDKDILTASDLNNHLDQLTDATGCQNITVVYEACNSGSFIDELSRAGRIIVTSTGLDADSKPTEEMGGVFSYYFFNSISAGDTIKEAFEAASDSPEIKVHSKLLERAGKPPQTPLLDDNGDSVGHGIPLLDTGDGLLAASKYVGTQGGALGIAPTITEVIPSQKVVVNTTITIWSVVDDDSSIKDVYASIFEPNFNISSTNNIPINLTTLYLEDSDGDDNYTASFTPTELGNYTLILHATDDEGYMLSPKQCIITVVSSSENAIFDTGEEIYTYQCKETGGHYEFVNIGNLNWKGGDAYGNGYVGDGHSITLNETFVLYKNKTYHYTIITGSYPHIIHESSKDVFGGRITCSDFTDMNGHLHNNWIPAIRLGVGLQ